MMEATRMRYGRKESAWKLGISIRSIDYLIARKLLDTRRDGKRIFITHASLVKYAATNHYGAFACVFRSMWAGDSIRCGHLILFDVGSYSVVMWAAFAVLP